MNTENTHTTELLTTSLHSVKPEIFAGTLILLISLWSMISENKMHQNGMYFEIELYRKTLKLAKLICSQFFMFYSIECKMFAVM